MQSSSCLWQLVSCRVWIHAFALHAAPVERLLALVPSCQSAPGQVFVNRYTRGTLEGKGGKGTDPAC